jgi:uncharacterized protein (TIGR02246 family)
MSATPGHDSLRARLPLLAASLLIGTRAIAATTQCTPELRDHSADVHHVSAMAASTIDAANAAWFPAMQRGDTQAMAAPYADDGVLVTTAGTAIRGRAEIADYYRNSLSSIGHITGKLIQDSVVAAGGLIYEWGHAVTAIELKDGSRRDGGGSYLTVWRETEPCRWQIIRNLVF